MNNWEKFVKNKQLIEADIQFSQLPKKRPDGNFAYYQNILKKYNKKEHVEFALFILKSMFDLINAKDRGKILIGLVEKWLNNPDDSIVEQIRNSLTLLPFAPASADQLMRFLAFTVIHTNETYNSAAFAASSAIYLDSDIEPKIIQFLHSLGENDGKIDNTNQLQGFIKDLSSNESILNKHDTIQIFLDFLEETYGISNIRSLGHYSADPQDQNSIFNNPLALNNFLRLIKNRINNT